MGKKIYALAALATAGGIVYSIQSADPVDETDLVNE